MFKWFSFLAITVLCSASLSAQSTPQKTSRAKMTISENVWDFGYIPQSSSVLHIYRITNVGKDSLFIEKVRPSCGCTAAPLKKDKLAPKESTDLFVTFNSGKFNGPVGKGIHITSNDSTLPAGRSITFSAIVGDKNPIATLNPQSVEFDSIRTQKDNRRYIKLDNFSGNKLNVSLLDNPGGFLKIKIKDQQIGANQSTQVEVRLRENLEPGWLKTSFTLQLDGGQKVRATIPVKAFINKESK